MILIAGVGAETVLAHRVGEIRAALAAAEPDWLAPGRACDLLLSGGDAMQAETAARQAIGDAAIDVLVQPAEGRRKRVFVADLESTIIENEMLDERGSEIELAIHRAPSDLGDMSAEPDKFRQLVEITRRAMNGELDFTAALAERV